MIASVKRAASGGAIVLIAPALLLLMIAFIAPLWSMLERGITDRDIQAVLPRTARALHTAPRGGLPDDTTARTLAAELGAADRAGKVSIVANRLNYDIAGSRSLVLRTAASIDSGTPVKTLADLARIDPRWHDTSTWTALRQATASPTSFYLWAALDRRPDVGGAHPVPIEQRVFVAIYLRSFKIAGLVTLLCLILGYPVAYFLAHQPTRRANLLLLLVLLPFWTSTLVRTTAWVVLLQDNGVVNRLLQAGHLTIAPLPLVYNRFGVYVAMTHVLLPFLILPLYGVMVRIPPDATRAARSLGAGAFTAFRRIYWPQSLPGVAAGAAIVFTLALGYYLTPALVGGGGDQMISGSIAYYASETSNWGMAAALSWLLLAPLALVLVAVRTRMRTALVR